MHMRICDECYDAAQFFHAQEGYESEKLFWSQFVEQERPLLLNDQMAQWAELHKMSSAAMKDVVVRLCPAKAIPGSYFGLVRRLVDALPRVDAVKRWSCIKGARMAFARVKMHWVKMNAKKVAVGGPPESKAHRTPDRYFEDVPKDAHLVEGPCSKDVAFA